MDLLYYPGVMAFSDKAQLVLPDIVYIDNYTLPNKAIGMLGSAASIRFLIRRSLSFARITNVSESSRLTDNLLKKGDKTVRTNISIPRSIIKCS